MRDVLLDLKKPLAEHIEIIVLCTKLLNEEIDAKYFCNHLEKIRMGLDVNPFVEWMDREKCALEE